MTPLSEKEMPKQIDRVLVEARGVHKWFGATHALRGLDLKVRGGRVHALLGANGCGKSTLVKILAGYHEPTKGHLRWDDHADQGIAFVHQDLGLIPNLTVAENLGLVDGFQMRGFAIDWSKQLSEADNLLMSNGIECAADELVGSLGPAEQTMIAIVRAVAGLPEKSGVLVLDEPTARLPANEADRLLKLIKTLKRKGVAILYISHRLDEVREIGDEVTVLRDGASVYHGEVADTDEKVLVRLIVGRDFDPTPSQFQDAEANERRTRINAQGLFGVRLHDVNLCIKVGEVLGIAGLVGSGRSELARTLFGLQVASHGKVTLDDHDISHASTKRTVELGMGYVPQERSQGIFHGLSVEDNAVIVDLPSAMARFGLSRTKLRKAAQEVVGKFQVKTDGLSALIGTLSGGNQQKVSLGKWFQREIKFMILDEPTQGIDIGARAEIFHIIRQMAQEHQVSVLVLDSDLEILSSHCDRVLVMSRGRIVRELHRAQLSEDALSHEVYRH